jgi:cytochrome c oxidase assembly factor CtaG
MAGPSEEAGKAVNTFVDALKGQPLSLALVAMNVLLIGFLYYTGIVAHDERKTEMQLLYQNRTEMAQLLFQCTPARPESGQH